MITNSDQKFGSSAAFPSSSSPIVVPFEPAGRIFRLILAPLAAVLAFKVMLLGLLLVRLGSGLIVFAPRVLTFGLEQFYVSLINLGFLSRILQPTPALIFSDDGLEDLSGPAAAGLIPWSTIDSARPENLFLHKGVAIHIEDPDGLMVGAAGFRWCLMQWNHHLFATPVHVPIEGIGITADDLIDRIYERIPRRNERPVVDGPLVPGAPYNPREEYTTPYVENPRATRRES